MLGLQHAKMVLCFFSFFSAESAAISPPNALPSPWVEYYSDQHGRPYYHNPETGVRVWEKPTAPPLPRMPSPSPTHKLEPAKLPKRAVSDKAKRIQERPLPSIPQDMPQEHLKQPGSPVTRTHTMPATHARPPVGKQGRGPLPQFPPGSPAHHGPSHNAPLSPVPIEKRGPAPLPGQENTPPPVPQANRPRRHFSIGAGSRNQPPLPAKDNESEKKMPALPPKESETPMPLKQMVPPLPEKDAAPEQPGPTKPQELEGGKVWKRVGIFEGSAKPPLPDTKNKATGPPPLPEKEKSSPPLPVFTRGPVPPTSKRQVESEYDDIPMGPIVVPLLPEKEKERPVLPPKEDEPTPVAPTPKAIPPPLPEKEEEKKVPPPLPAKEDEPEPQAHPPPPQLGGGVAPPPPPPLPPLDFPPPPPLIPETQPSGGGSGFKPLGRELRSHTTSDTSSGGRPFTANDLLMGAQRLRKVDESDLRKSPVPEADRGLEGCLNRALKEKFKNYASDSEEEEFDDVDDEWD